MPDCRIAVDGETIYNGDPGDWKQPLPDQITAALKPNAKPQPWLKAVAITMAETLATNRPLQATVTTRLDGWTLDITIPPNGAAHGHTV